MTRKIPNLGMIFKSIVLRDCCKAITKANVVKSCVYLAVRHAIDEIKRLDMLLEYAVQHGDEVEAARIREELKSLTESI